MSMSTAKQQRNASYAAGYFDGYSGNCYCIGIGGSLYHRGYVKGSSDAAKRTAKYRTTHKLVQRPALCIILWNLFWHRWNARF